MISAVGMLQAAWREMEDARLKCLASSFAGIKPNEDLLGWAAFEDKHSRFQALAREILGTTSSANCGACGKPEGFHCREHFVKTIQELKDQLRDLLDNEKCSCRTVQPGQNCDRCKVSVLQAEAQAIANAAQATQPNSPRWACYCETCRLVRKSLGLSNVDPKKRKGEK